MQLPPTEVFLSWPRANYEHPSEIRGPAILIITVIAVPILLALVALRVYTRLRLTKNFGPDDTAIVAALVPTLGCAVLSLVAVRYHGWDRHVWDVPVPEIYMALKYAMAVEVLFSFACLLTRLSILLFIRRMMAEGSKFWKRLTMALVVLVCVEEGIFCVVTINTCSYVFPFPPAALRIAKADS